MSTILTFIRTSKVQTVIAVAVVALIATPLFLVLSEQAGAEEEPSLLNVNADIGDQWAERDQNHRRMIAVTTQVQAALCLTGKTEFCVKTPAPKKLTARRINIDLLAYAVATKETQNCTTGTGRSHLNNCFGIKGKKGFRKFESKEESYEAFKTLWLSRYCDCLPNLALAKKYSGEEGTNWLKDVLAVYNRGEAQMKL